MVCMVTEYDVYGVECVVYGNEYGYCVCVTVGVQTANPILKVKFLPLMLPFFLWLIHYASLPSLPQTAN